MGGHRRGAVRRGAEGQDHRVPRALRGEGETLEDLLPEAFAVVREAAKRTSACATSTCSDGRHRAARGQHRRDEDRRGQDARGHAAAVPERARRHRRRTWSRSTTTWPAATPSWMGPVYEALGVTVGVIQADMDARGERRAAVPAATSPTARTPSSASTTCATTWRRRSTSACSAATAYAIVDEVDSILIDEARTPLIISGQPEEAAETYFTFAEGGHDARRSATTTRSTRSARPWRPPSRASHKVEPRSASRTCTPPRTGSSSTT